VSFVFFFEKVDVRKWVTIIVTLRGVCFYPYVDIVEFLSDKVWCFQCQHQNVFFLVILHQIIGPKSEELEQSFEWWLLYCY